MIPLVLIGSFQLVIISLPIPSYQKFMLNIFGNIWKSLFIYIQEGTFGIMSLIMVISISYSYAVLYGEKFGNKISPIIVSLVSLSSFIALSGIMRNDFTFSNFGVVGIFISITVSLSSSIIFIKLVSFDFFDIKATSEGANPVFNHALRSAWPAGITILIFAFINLVLFHFFNINNIQAFVSDFIVKLFISINSIIVEAFVFIFLVHFFWFFGIHGSNVLEPVAQKIFIPALESNKALIEAGLAPTEIFTKTFFDTFVLMGGCGTALSLLLAIFITRSYKGQRKLAKLSLFPVLFNINEMIVFGVPIVLNPVYFIPFITVPIFSTLSSFIALKTGLVPYTINSVEWTTPVFLSAYTATGSISGSILQLFNLIVGTMIYLPFVKIAESKAHKQVMKNLDKVYSVFKVGENRGIASSLLSRYDDIGIISRLLASNLKADLKNNKITMYYQPQIDYEGNVFGIEALLRWKHDIYGYIYPPFAIALAEEMHLIDELGYHILETACSDMMKLRAFTDQNITLSVNISGYQLESKLFASNVKKIISKYNINPENMEIEITEQVALTTSNTTLVQFMKLKDLGIKLAMDDFGMGHSSLMYLKEHNFSTIKLDGSLIKDLLTNRNCQEIISSIMYLSKSLGFSVIAEYVDNDQQKELLHQLECNKYQGYLYSKPLSYNELIHYLSNIKVTCIKNN